MSEHNQTSGMGSPDGYCPCCGGFSGDTSRRAFFKAGAAAVVGGAAAQMLPGASFGQAVAQTAGDPELSRVQSQRRILLKGGVILSLDRQVGDFARGDVLIEDGKIREVRPNIEVSGDSVAVVDASDRIVIPGFIDTHSHSYQGILRNILVNGRVDPDYNRDIIGKLTPGYTPVDAHIGMLSTALGMIDMGITGVIDVSQVNNTPEHSDALVRALQESGIRAVFGYAGGAGVSPQNSQEMARLQRTYFNSKDQLISLALSPPPTPPMFQLARQVGVPVVTHVRNTLPGRDDGKRLADLAAAGLLRPGDALIHCLHFPPETWKLIKDSGLRVSLSPPIEMTMGHGTPATQEALDGGVRPSLSSDHAVTLTSDMFTMMRATFVMQRYFAMQRERNREPEVPPRLTCRDLLEFATIEGARCANVEGKVGTLTPGKEADIVLLRADRIDVWPLNNAPGTVVNLMTPRHVETVFINGKVKKWRGELVGVDVPGVLRSMQQARDGLLQRTGFPLDLLG
jgi:cytosine/adenosine deaminase-related metal-dependent hydrolase